MAKVPTVGRDLSKLGEERKKLVELDAQTRKLGKQGRKQEAARAHPLVTWIGSSNRNGQLDCDSMFSSSVGSSGHGHGNVTYVQLPMSHHHPFFKIHSANPVCNSDGSFQLHIRLNGHFPNYFMKKFNFSLLYHTHGCEQELPGSMSNDSVVFPHIPNHVVRHADHPLIFKTTFSLPNYLVIAPHPLESINWGELCPNLHMDED